jgi:ABC-2 type transport system ATP-binding protein
VSVASLEGVTKRFGEVTALDHVSLALHPGDILALLGANGAGKSTAIAILLGLRAPDRGEARLFGVDPRRPRARQLVGVALQESAYPATLRTRELVELVRAHYVFPLPTSALLGGFGLDGLKHRQVGGLSGGERRRLSVALAFAGRPSLVVLDEPTAGLDGDARHATWAAIRQHAVEGGTTLLTTHHIEEAEALATRIVLIDAGAIVTDGSVSSIKAGAGLACVTFGAPRGVAVEGAERDGDFLRILTPDPGRVVQRLVLEGVQLDDLDVRRLTLEEAIAARGRRR